VKTKKKIRVLFSAALNKSTASKGNGQRDQSQQKADPPENRIGRAGYVM
jgi:hypothetical protein